MDDTDEVMHGNWRHGGNTDGHLMIPKPKWFTGRPTQRYVPVHQAVYCLVNGLTAVPKGHCVHHVDEDKHNNHIDNLQMMTLREHVLHHHHGDKNHA